MNEKIRIKVFITKSLKFRVKISERGKPSYEVTVGGKSWNEGKGHEYRERIRTKTNYIMAKLAIGLFALDKAKVEGPRTQRLIVAGNYNQFRQYIREHRIPMQNAIYVSRLEVVQGCRQEELENIIFTGLWYERKGLDDIIDHLRSRGIKMEGLK